MKQAIAELLFSSMVAAKNCLQVLTTETLVTLTLVPTALVRLHPVDAHR